MCGRFSLGVDTDRLVAEFGIASVAEPHEPRYNIAPTQPVPAVVRSDGGLRLGALRWGLVPYWADDPGIGARMINARSETVATKPAFRDPFRERRCWVLADGFYEWEERDGQKVPIHFRLPDSRPFAFAGLWDRWGDGDAEIVSCTVLTTEPSDAVRPVHDRMPVILPEEERAQWLDPAADPDALQTLLRPYPGPLEGRRVSTRVNRPENDDPSLIEPVGSDT
ncbi:MAG: SOS response-associated peptidase [Longimicrobiales bacterium]|nr:SOS response-associated peptidase [Longimicrobiales bacterium]